MKENSLYDRKSLSAVTGRTADFNELAKDCVAFSNAQGGIIEIGIEDKETMPPVGQVIPRELTTQIVNRISGLTNAVNVSADICRAKNGGEYIRLQVFRNSNAVSVTTSGKIYLRVGDNSVPVGSEDISRLVEEKGCFSWEDEVTGYEWQRADKTKLNNLLRRIKDSDRVSSSIKQKDTKELLDYFYLTEPDSDNLTNLGVLFIGTQPQRGRMQNAPVIQCIKYDQYGGKVNKWLWDDYAMNPIEIITDIWETVPEWRESTEIADGLFRRNIPAYPESVIREILVNAMVHRPYTVRGDIFINIHPDYVEVVNPGQLPLGVTADNILHTTRKRNEHMANLFYVLNLMEREGSGYDMMYETLLANGKTIPKVSEGDDWVNVRVERKVVNQETIRIVWQAEQRYALKQKQLICLGLIALHKSVTGMELVRLLNLKDSDALRSWLHPLVENGLVTSTNARTKAKKYSVDTSFLKDGHYQGRTSPKGLEKYRIKELIVADLKIYKEATLPEIQSRIGNEIAQKKIREQLDSLIDAGKVKAVGQNRWRKYIIME